MSATTRKIFGALSEGGLVHWLELHRSPQTSDVWALFCGGYTTRVYWHEVPYVTCVLCAAGMDYWREA